jgi:hypothetical protein
MLLYARNLLRTYLLWVGYLGGCPQQLSYTGNSKKTHNDISCLSEQVLAASLVVGDMKQALKGVGSLVFETLIRVIRQLTK